jgi:very-short-patch-repair endonuclease
MDAAQLPKNGRSSIAQSVNSLFDFAEKRPMSRRLFLADQFRSAPGIVDYINEEFYAGRLIARREADDLRLPRDYKPGLGWHNVKGRPSREDGGNINVPEADAVVDLIADMIRERGFDGSLGVLSPFDAQVGLITRLAKERLTIDERTRVSLKVATIDKFQGGEADVILFSPVIGEAAAFGVANFLRRERRRLNVAISRARALCLVVGDLDHALKSDIPHLRNLARQATSPYSPPRATFDSEWERRLDVAMRRRGLDPNPQYPVGRKYLDFALFAGGIKLDVEVDGRAFHTDADGNRKISDRLRDKELITRGWKVRRFWVSELHFDMERCLDRIQSDLRPS